MNKFLIALGQTMIVTTTVTTAGAAVNLSGCRVLFVVKRYESDPDGAAIAMMDNLTLGGVTVTNPASGQATITMSASATYGLFNNTFTPLFYEIWVKDSLGNEFRTEKGTIEVDARLLVQQP